MVEPMGLLGSILVDPIPAGGGWRTLASTVPSEAGQIPTVLEFVDDGLVGPFIRDCNRLHLDGDFVSTPLISVEPE
jgi:hypothetical protein